MEQLDEIYSYLEDQNPRTALRVKARIRRAVERLATFPYSSRETELPGVRVLGVTRYPYLVFYSVDEHAEEVRVLRVRHMARDPKNHLT